MAGPELSPTTELHTLFRRLDERCAAGAGSRNCVPNSGLDDEKAGTSAEREAGNQAGPLVGTQNGEMRHGGNEADGVSPCRSSRKLWSRLHGPLRELG